VRRAGDFRAVVEHLLAADHAGAVAAAERARKAEAGGGERLEAERRQDLRAARVPGIRNDKSAAALVQRAEGARFFNLSGRHSPYINHDG
jgi:hypothetical protein